jgi:hypothetical protein
MSTRHRGYAAGSASTTGASEKLEKKQLKADVEDLARDAKDATGQ